MRKGAIVIAGVVALAVFIASLFGLWRVIVDNADMRFTGEALTTFARAHPPKPWRGFQTTILEVSVDGEVHIKAHVDGNMIHTPVEISGVPDYDGNARAVFFHISKTTLPHEKGRPMLSRLNAMLNPLASYIAQDLTDFIPAKRIKPETKGGALILTTVKAVRVDGDAVVVEFQSNRVVVAAAILTAVALLSAAALLYLALRTRRSLRA